MDSEIASKQVAIGAGARRSPISRLTLGIIFLAHGASAFDLNDYITQCRQKGVNLPSATELDCSKNPEIPIYKTVCRPGMPPQKIRVTWQNYGELEQEFGTPLTCDNPQEVAFLKPQDRCAPGSTARTIPVPGGICAFLCRKNRNDSSALEKYSFDDINLICHSPKNGATCFFNTSVPTHRFDGERLGVPSSYNRQWMQWPEYHRNVCTQCHDRGPFLLSPFVRQAIEPGLSGYDISMKHGRYFAVAAATDELPEWNRVWSLTDPEVHPCTLCHRIGFGGNFCGYLSSHAGGRFRLNAFSDSCPGTTSRYMPPDFDTLSAKEDHPYQSAIARIEECCQGFLRWKQTPGTDPLSAPPPGPHGRCRWDSIPGEDKEKPNPFYRPAGSHADQVH